MDVATSGAGLTRVRVRYFRNPNLLPASHSSCQLENEGLNDATGILSLNSQGASTACL
jgi:hypothetical protein